MDTETMKSLIFLLRMMEKRVGGGDAWQAVAKWVRENGGDPDKDPYNN